jgi:hypothetical protein
MTSFGADEVVVHYIPRDRAHELYAIAIPRDEVAGPRNRATDPVR